MDAIDYKNNAKSPVRPSDLALLQEMTAMVADAVVGCNAVTDTGSYPPSLIMRGCELQGNVITAGVLCIEGELMYANAGLKNTSGQTKYSIVETVSDAISNSEIYTAWRTIRRAVVDNVNGTFIWDNADRYSTAGMFSEYKSIETKEYLAEKYLTVKRIGDTLSIKGQVGGVLGNEKNKGDVLLETGFKAKHQGGIGTRFFPCYYDTLSSFFYAYIDDDGAIRALQKISGTSSYGGLFEINALIEF